MIERALSLHILFVKSQMVSLTIFSISISPCNQCFSLKCAELFQNMREKFDNQKKCTKGNSFTHDVLDKINCV